MGNETFNSLSSVKCELFYYICGFYLSGWSGSSPCNHGALYFPLQIKADQSKAFGEGGGGGGL